MVRSAASAFLAAEKALWLSATLNVGAAPGAEIMRPARLATTNRATGTPIRRERRQPRTAGVKYYSATCDQNRPFASESKRVLREPPSPAPVERWFQDAGSADWRGGLPLARVASELVMRSAAHAAP